MKFQINQNGFKLNGSHQLRFNINNFNILAETKILQKTREHFSVLIRETALDITLSTWS